MTLNKQIGSAVARIEYANASVDTQRFLVMSAKAMDSRNVLKVHIENHVQLLLEEVSILSLVNIAGILNWNVSTSLLTNNGTTTLQLIEKPYGNIVDDYYYVLVTAQLIYQGENSTRWNWELMDAKLGYDNSIVGYIEASLYFTDPTIYISDGVIRSYFAVLNGNGDPQLLTDQAVLWYGKWNLLMII